MCRSWGSGGWVRWSLGFDLLKRVENLARCGFLLRGMAGQGVGLAAEFGLEGGGFFPAGDGVAVDFEGGGGGGDGMAGQEEAGGGELEGF